MSKLFTARPATFQKHRQLLKTWNIYDIYVCEIWDNEEMAGTDYIVSLSSPEHVNYINKLVLSNGEELPDPSPFQEMTTN